MVVDEGGEERKGGASGLAKCFLSSSITQLVMLFHVPKDLNDTLLPMKEWADALIAAVGGEVTKSDETTMTVIAKGDPEKALYPLKMRDAAMNASFVLLRAKDMMLDDEEDVDLGALAEDAGIEW